MIEAREMSGLAVELEAALAANDFAPVSQLLDRLEVTLAEVVDGVIRPASSAAKRLALTSDWRPNATSRATPTT